MNFFCTTAVIAISIEATDSVTRKMISPETKILKNWSQRIKRKRIKIKEAFCNLNPAKQQQYAVNAATAKKLFTKTLGKV